MTAAILLTDSNTVTRTPEMDRRRCWDRGNGRGTCESCGSPKGIGSGPKAAVCRRCYVEAASNRQERRRRHIEALWNEGLSCIELAREIGVSSAALRMEVARMRKDGWDVPLRRVPKVGADA